MLSIPFAAATKYVTYEKALRDDLSGAFSFFLAHRVAVDSVKSRAPPNGVGVLFPSVLFRF